MEKRLAPRANDGQGLMTVTGKSSQQLLSTETRSHSARTSTTQTLLHRTIAQRRAAQRRRQRTQKRRAERRNRLQQARLTRSCSFNNDSRRVSPRNCDATIRKRKYCEYSAPTKKSDPTGRQRRPKIEADSPENPPFTRRLTNTQHQTVRRQRNSSSGKSSASHRQTSYKPCARQAESPSEPKHFVQGATQERRAAFTVRIGGPEAPRAGAGIIAQKIAERA